MKATANKERFAYFTPLGREVLIDDFQHIFRNKSNPTEASKEKELPWQNGVY